MRQESFSKESLQNRIEEIGVTLYQIAKKYSEIKGESSPASRYHSTLSKCIENPQNSRLETLELLIKAMGGNLVIEWEETVDKKEFEQFKIESRVCKLEDSVKRIESLLSKIAEKF